MRRRGGVAGAKSRSPTHLTHRGLSQAPCNERSLTRKCTICKTTAHNFNIYVNTTQCTLGGKRFENSPVFVPVGNEAALTIVLWIILSVNKSNGRMYLLMLFSRDRL